MEQQLKASRKARLENGLVEASRLVDEKLKKGAISHSSAVSNAYALRQAKATADEVNGSHVGRANAAVSRSYFGGASK